MNRFMQQSLRRSLLSALFVATLALASTGVARAAVCHVNWLASGANNGSSWTDAYTDLQSALLQAACTEVWVARGLYYPVQPVNYNQPTSAERDVSFVIPAGVSVYGGFVGTETQRETRDPVMYPTLLSGDIDQNDDVSSTTIARHWADIDGVMDGNGLNSRHVVRFDGSVTPVTASTVLDGFVISGGYANGSQFGDGTGGGVYCDGKGVDSVCSPTLSNLRLFGNYAQRGSALAAVATDGGTSSPTLIHVYFTDNGAGEHGGTVALVASEDAAQTATGTSHASLEDVRFKGNQAGVPNDAAPGWGGGLLNVAHAGGDVSPTLTQVQFVDNQALNGGGAIANMADGGSIQPSLTQVTMQGNNAAGSTSHGGAIATQINGGGSVTIDLDQSLLVANTAGNGGAISSNTLGTGSTYSLTLDSVTLQDNQAASLGGALLLQAQSTVTDTLRVTNSTFSGNQASAGGALTMTSASGATLDANVDYSSFANNNTSQGSSASVVLQCASGSCTAKLSNSILWNATSASALEIASQSASPVWAIEHSIVRGGAAGVSVSSGTPFASGPGNLADDPQLAALGSYGGATPTVMPMTGSAAIEAGACDPGISTDQRGVARPQGASCDIGAVEVSLATVTVDVGPGGSVETSSPLPAAGAITDCRQTSGSCAASWATEPWQPTVVLTIQPDAGYGAATATGCPGTLSGGYFVMPSLAADCTLHVDFTAGAYQVGGTVTGLFGSGLELSLNNGTELLPIGGDGPFNFTTALSNASSYAVSISGQPTSPTQTCVVVNGSGTISGGDVTDVVVNCGPVSTYTVGGSLSGLAGGASITLQVNGGNDLTLGADGSWVFPLFFAPGDSYVVNIAQQPTGQHCTISNPMGTVGSANVGNIDVDCAVGGPELSLSVSDGGNFARYGHVRDYFVTLVNSGNDKADDVAVSASFGAAFDVALTQWSCFGSGDVTCTPSGSGGFADSVSLAAGSSITWLVSVPVLRDSHESSGTMVFHADGATDAADTNTLVIFRDSMDVPYGDGTQLAPGADANVMTPPDTDSFSVQLPQTLPAGVVSLRRIEQGDLRFQLQALHWRGQYWVRLLGHAADGQQHASRWGRADAGAWLLLGSLHVGDGAQVILLEGDHDALRLLMP